MYSGITRGTRPVVGRLASDVQVDIIVDLGAELAAGLDLGASVSIDGVCLTVAGLAGPTRSEVLFQVIRETLERTTLGSLEVGSKVSVERSYRIGDELGGHELAGHVLGTGRIDWLSDTGQQRDMRISVPREWMKYILRKGFIAVDGSSLTVGETDARGTFELHLIPETLRLTNLGLKQVGDRVNIELDARTVAIVDSVERILAERLGASADAPRL
jgi:riboflavin synthase